MTPGALSQRPGSGPVTQVELDLSGCVNGVPTAVRGRGHFAGPEDGLGSRLDLELVADVLPLQWDLALALPCFLDALLFVMGGLPVENCVEAHDVDVTTGARSEPLEFMRSEARAVTDMVLLDGVDCELGRAMVLHSIRLGPRSVSLVSQVRSARFELEVGERVMAISAERSDASLAVGLEGCAMLSTGEVSTGRGRDCSYVATTRISWPHDVLALCDLGGRVRVELERAKWNERGGRVLLSIVMREGTTTKASGQAPSW